jgi:hypothetical protein
MGKPLNLDKVNCKKIEIEPYSSSFMELTGEFESTSEILNQIIAEHGVGFVLDEIGKSEILEYFNITEKEE